jgi:double-stranded uracil-DNA glycosylase
MTLRGFVPIADSCATRLILGSMPGQASLQAGEYYAFTHNAFWRIIEACFDIPCNADYRQRRQALQARGVAVWDVLQSCERASSLDADIVAASVVANDFAQFFRQHPAIRQVYFNGACAEQLYKRHVLPGLGEAFNHIQYYRLPSTSPANARLRFDAKLAAWQVITG